MAPRLTTSTARYVPDDFKPIGRFSGDHEWPLLGDHRGEDASRYAELSTRFHERLMELSGNETLALVVGMLYDIIERHAKSSMRETLDPKTLKKTIRSQEKLVELIEAGDEEGAEKHWRNHVVNAGQIVLGKAGRKSIVDLVT